MKIAFLGASLTEGVYGGSYVKTAAKHYGNRISNLNEG